MIVLKVEQKILKAWVEIMVKKLGTKKSEGFWSLEQVYR